MDTFFWVNVMTLTSQHKLGPYIQLESALEIMTEHLTAIAPSLGIISIKEKYVSEETFSGSTWTIITEKERCSPIQKSCH